MDVNNVCQHQCYFCMKKDFENVKILGKGAFGRVVKARKKVDEIDYAIKIIKINSEEDHGNVDKEVKALAKLKHRHIISYVHAWIESENICQSDEQDTSTNESNSCSNNESDSLVHFERNDMPCYMYLQMELCTGGTLRELIDKDISCNKDLIRDLFGQLVDGLAYIHRRKLIHRDLKPSNILLTNNNYVKIADFGLAVAIGNKTLSDINGIVYESKTASVGTSFYMAPEMKRKVEDLSRVYYSQKVDVYSLGVIFFEMCHKPFYTASERDQVLSNLRDKNVILPKTLQNTKQRNLIKRLLTHNVFRRPSSQMLLKSEYILPLLPKDYELKKLLDRLLDIPQWKDYLTHRCTGQESASLEKLIHRESKMVF